METFKMGARFFSYTFTVVAILAAAMVMLIGCGEAPGVELMPNCDTLRTVEFVSRCDAGHARCDLRAEAAPGSKATGCMLTVISQPSGTPEQVECVAVCQ